MRRVWLYGSALAALGVLLIIQLGEGAIRIAPQFRFPPDAHTADRIATSTASTWKQVETHASDGVLLRASLFQPAQRNGGAVILLHGVADSRGGMLGHARYLLEAGYTCLLPDSRGHGISGGDVISYGIRESTDVARWADWLKRNVAPQRLYGMGESMGAAILLESLPKVPEFRAVVAECSFSDFRTVACDRLAQLTGLHTPWLFRPAVESGFLYVRTRYGITLDDASPSNALRASQTPVLLIHGTRDTNIPPSHSERLAAIRPASITLWEVPGAVHVDALGTASDRFPKAVLSWYSSHKF